MGIDSLLKTLRPYLKASSFEKMKGTLRQKPVAIDGSFLFRCDQPERSITINMIIK